MREAPTQGKGLPVCYVDYEKAFDGGNWIKLFGILKNILVYWIDIRLITELHIG